jgi:hypothetical protein
MNQKINRQEIIEKFHQMRKEDEQKEKIEQELHKSIDEGNCLVKVKMDIINRQQNFLSSINFDDIKIVTIHNEFSCGLSYVDTNYDIYNHHITYSIEYNNGLVTKKKDIIKKVFRILYTKPHFVEFIDDIEIIHFVKIVN